MFLIQNYCHYILQYIGVIAQLPLVTEIVVSSNNFPVSVHFLQCYNMLRYGICMYLCKHPHRGCLWLGSASLTLKHKRNL